MTNMRTALGFCLSILVFGCAPTTSPTTANSPPSDQHVTGVTIDSPANDDLVSSETLSASGTVTGDGFTPGTPQVKLQVAAKSYVAAVGADQRWRVTGISVPNDISIWSASSGDHSASLLVTRIPDLKPRPHRKVFFDWQPGVDDQISKIAVKTLSNPPSGQALDAFVGAVHAHTLTAFSRAYSAIGVDVVNNQNDADQIILLKPDNDDAYGRTEFNCCDARQNTTSTIFVGAYLDDMTNHFEWWKPMSKDDSIVDRIVDLGEIFGRTCAHETGHALGLVGFQIGTPCASMRGSDDWHNSPTPISTLPNVQRFGHGQEIMDSGDDTPNNWRMAENSGSRGVRTPSTFCHFNVSYLSAIHPK